MNENTFEVILSHFFSCHLFWLQSNFKIIRCIVKSLITIQYISVEVQLKKRKLEKCFLGTRVWVPRPVYVSPKWPGYVSEYVTICLNFDINSGVSNKKVIAFYR